MSISHPNRPPGWCNETKAVHCSNVVDGIKDPLYHNGQNNEKRTPFFKEVKWLKGKAFVGISTQEELPSKYFNSILVPFLSKKLLTLNVFILNTKIEFLLYSIFLSQGLEGKGTDPITPPMSYFGWVVLAMKGIPWCVNCNGFDKCQRKHL